MCLSKSDCFLLAVGSGLDFRVFTANSMVKVFSPEKNIDMIKVKLVLRLNHPLAYHNTSFKLGVNIAPL